MENEHGWIVLKVLREKARYMSRRMTWNRMHAFDNSRVDDYLVCDFLCDYSNDLGFGAAMGKSRWM